MNFCAWSQGNDMLANWTISHPLSLLDSDPIASVEMPVGVSCPSSLRTPLAYRQESVGTHINIADTDTPRHYGGVDESRRSGW